MWKQWAAGAPVIGAASVPAEKPNRPWSEGYQAVERSIFFYLFFWHVVVSRERDFKSRSFRNAGDLVAGALFNEEI